MRVGYAKFTRSWNSERANASTVGGDIDVWRLLQRLAQKRPQHEYVMIGRHQGGLHEFPKNVSTIWDDPRMEDVKITDGTVTREVYEGFINKWRAATDDVRVDAFIGWIGQVGNANSPIPQIGTDWSDNKLANPYLMNVRYTAPLCDFLNRRGIQPILLTPDPRNWWRPRELMRPITRPILSQFDMVRQTKHEQFDQWGMPWQQSYSREQSVIVADASYEYAGLEYTALDDPSAIPFNDSFDRPHHLGIISNENKTEVPDSTSRRLQLQQWVLDKYPETPVHGSWTKESQEYLGRTIEPVPQTEMLERMATFRATITFPASGSGWVTAKWAEAAAVGTVCFIHPEYDTQDHIFKWAEKSRFRELKHFVRVFSPFQFNRRLEQLKKDPGLFNAMITMQRELLISNFDRWHGGAAAVIDALDEVETRKDP